MTDVNGQKIRMRFYPKEYAKESVKKGRVLYKVLFKHPMHTTYSNTETNTAFYIQDIRFYLRDKMVMHTNTSENVSRNFLLQFYLVDVQQGDDFRVEWVDNIGNKEIYTTKVKYYVAKK